MHSLGYAFSSSLRSFPFLNETSIRNRDLFVIIPYVLKRRVVLRI